MKIGMLTDVYKPVINGITNFISLCKATMEAAGHQVFVFTFGQLDYHDEEARIVRSPAVPLSDTGYYFSLMYSRPAREQLREMDILHVHHPFMSGRLAIQYGRQFNLPVVYTNHTRYDLYAQAYLPLIPPALTHAALETFMPSFATLCDLVLAPSAGVKRVLQELGVEKEIVVVPNGIDLERLSQPATRISRAALGVPDDATLLMYCGRLGPEKNLDFLLKAFAGAAVAVPDAHLVLVGGGPEEQELRERAVNMPRVTLTGEVVYDEVPGYLAAADIFVTPSVTEVHPLSVIEALAAGLPVLGIHSPGISDTVRHALDGYLTAHDLPSYTAMLVRMLLEPERRAEMAATARQRSQQYDIRATVSTLLAQYERLISEAKLRPPKEKLWQTLAREVQQVLGE